MLSGKSNETMHNCIKKIKANDAQCYQGNQTSRGIALSRKSNQTIHNVIMKIIPDDAYVIREIIPKDK